MLIIPKLKHFQSKLLRELDLHIQFHGHLYINLCKCSSLFTANLYQKMESPGCPTAKNLETTLDSSLFFILYNQPAYNHLFVSKIYLKPENFSLPYCLYTGAYHICQ